MAIQTTTFSRSPIGVGWRSPSFLVLLVAQFISLVGTQLTFVALPWFVLSTTGSPGLMTAVLVAETLPIAIFGIPAGALVDRVNKKWLMTGFDVARGLVIFSIPILAMLDRLEFWMIILVSFLSGLLNTPYLSARMAIIPALVGEDETELTRANTMLQFITQITGTLGAALAGILIVLMGNINVLLLNTATFIIASLLIGFGVHYEPEASQAQSDETWYEAFNSGLHFIWGHKAMRACIIIGMFVTLSFVVMTTACLPVFVKEVLDGNSVQLGWLLSAFGVGAIVGMLVYGIFADRWPWRPGQTISYFTIGMVVPLWLILLYPSFISALIALSFSTFFATPILIIIYTYIQTSTPDILRGRVFATFNALWLVITPLGLLVAGPLLERFGVMFVLWGVILLLTLCLIITWMLPVVREA